MIRLRHNESSTCTKQFEMIKAKGLILRNRLKTQLEGFE